LLQENKGDFYFGILVTSLNLSEVGKQILKTHTSLLGLLYHMKEISVLLKQVVAWFKGVFVKKEEKIMAELWNSKVTGKQC
jgi:hypothetical protein